MIRIMMHAKIHGATITDARIDYQGSLTLDPDLMDAAGLLPNEQVHVLNLTNGQRFETYVISGERGSGDVVVNGAAARLVEPGERAIIVAYAEMEDEEARSLTPRVILVDKDNRPLVGAHS